MLNFNIVLATENDIPKINEIVNYYIETGAQNWSWHQRSLKDAYKWFHSHDFNIHPIFAAKDIDNNVLGYSSLSVFRPKEGYWPVAENSIYVDKDYHGLNIGSELMQATLNHAYSSKLEVITSWIDSENKSSIDFHIKWGFEIVGEMKNVGDKWNERRSVTILQLDVKQK